jgi:hypothetical protein
MFPARYERKGKAPPIITEQTAPTNIKIISLFLAKRNKSIKFTFLMGEI